MCFEKFLYNFGNPSKAGGGSIKIRTALGKLILTFEMFAHLSPLYAKSILSVRFCINFFWLENVALSFSKSVIFKGRVCRFRHKPFPFQLWFKHM